MLDTTQQEEFDSRFQFIGETSNGDLNPVSDELKKLLRPIFSGKRFNTSYNGKHA